MSGHRSFPWVTLLVLAALAVGGFFGWRAWRGRADAEALTYKTSAVTRGDVTQSVTANGSLSPVRMVEVGSQISGVITSIKVDFNSQVKAGELVAQIDPATYERALGQAEAELENAQAAQELAQLNFDRAEGLMKTSLISKSDFDQARVNLSQAKATVRTREANVERARVDLSRTTIYSPMDGVVITRKVEEGQTVAASMNTPTLFVVANDLTKMRIEAAVSEADVGGVEEGQPVQFTVDAFPGRAFQGTVQQVRYEPTTNQNVVTYTTVVAVENKDMKLRPGMTANARFITAEHKNVLKIPNAALRFRPPAQAVVVGQTNGAAAAAVALVESGPFAGLPVMPWMAGGERRRPTEEERAAYAATLTPEQKKRYEQLTAEMRARFAQGGAGGAGGGGGGGGSFGGGGFPGSAGAEPRRAAPERPKTGVVYVFEKATGTNAPLASGLPPLRAVPVKLGIGDGSSVEVLEGLNEGDLVVAGTVTAAAAAPASRSLLGGPFGGPPRR